MNYNEIKTSLTELISNLFSEKGFDCDIIGCIDFIEDAGMDSITFISLIIEIESEFDVVVPDELLLIDNFRNLDAIIKIVEELLETGGSK